MAAEKKPRAAKAKAETKSTKTAAAMKPKTVQVRKPKTAAATPEQVAERAYYIWADGAGDDPFANWTRAERELTTA
jgi:hypothetical protein